MLNRCALGRSFVKSAFLVAMACMPTPLLAKKEAASEPSDRYKSLETLARGLFYLESLYVDPTKVTPDQLVTNALSGVVSKLDPHTMLMPSKAFEQLTIDTQGKFGGVGVIVSTERGKLIVISPIEDTPAYRAGIKSGDEIIALDDIPIEKFKDGSASDRMRGEPESKLKLTIRRKGIDKPLDFTLIREIIKVKSVRSEPLGDGILYARITSFQDNTTDELMEVMKKQPAGSIKGMILDLRDNPGGLLDQAVRISDMFIESGVIVSTVGRTQEDVEREFAHKRGTYSDFPMIALINGGSASASEIVAGALQDHERAVILGTTSFGKGSVQTLVSLPDHSGLKITIARYYTPKDRSIQAKGITPDIEVNENATPPKDASGQKSKKEADLKGHIESHDLSNLSKDSGVLKSLTSWPEHNRRDHQLVTAFTYIRGWSLFGRKAPAPADSDE